MIVDQYGQPIGKQEKHHPVRARYDSAVSSDKHWQMADSLSAVTANSAGVRATLRERSRYEIANNSYARGILNTIAAYTVGSGPTLQLSYRGDEPSDEITAAIRAVAHLWQTWAYARDMSGKIRTMQLALDGDGESFAMLTSNQRVNFHTPVTLDFRLYEADHFDNWSPGAGFFADDSGVRIDLNGDPSEYAFIEHHPGSALGYMSATSSQWVSAEKVVHLFRAERPEQLRGIPRTAPALELFAILRRFILATCTAAETAADFAAILTPETSEDGEEQAAPWDRLEIERGAFLTTPGGAKLSQLKAEHPNATFDEFVRAILREIARCLSVPAILALGDASRYNYSSGRLDPAL